MAKQKKKYPAIYDNYPVCPECNIRNYFIRDYSYIEGKDQVKFDVECNNCNTQFSYIKELEEIFKRRNK